MKRVYIILSLILYPFFWREGYAQQNLVPNYSFENITSCPNSASGVQYANMGWFSPNKIGDASNLYNTCQPQTASLNIPNTWSGYQWPHTGNGFVGMVLFDDTTSPQLNWSREYTEIQLIDTLRINKKYCVGFYTNMGNNNMWAIKNIQAVFTNDSLLYNDNNYGYIPGVSIAMESPSIISDTLNWVKVRGVYAALGGENFITIGNFSPGNQVIRHLAQQHYSTTGTGGYYLFDDISVYKQPDVFAGNDTLVHPGDTAHLGTTGRSDITYSWQPATGLSNVNIANPIAHPSVTTQYILTVTDTNQWACNNVMYDTVVVTVGYVGIKQQTGNTIQIKVYPNPASTSLTLKISEGEGTIIITDVLGNVVHYQIAKSANCQIDISNLIDGVYVYKVIVNNVSLQNNKLIIQR